MANHVSHAALPYPIKGARFTVLVPYLDADGDPTNPTTPDSEFSLDAGAFADCAEEVTTITGSNGTGYLTVTGAETDGSALALAFKVTSGPKATLMHLYPRVLPVLESGTAQAGAAGSITLAAGAAAYDLTGCIVKTTGGTGGGGTGGANNQARVVTAYNTSTKVATVEPNWETTPDVTTTYNVLLPDGVTLGMLRTLNPATAGRTLVVDAAGLADANAVKVGPTGAGVAQTAGDIIGDTNDIQARIPAALVSGRMDSSVGAMAANVLTAAAAAADFALEITNAVWDEDMTTHAIPNSFGRFTQDLSGTGATGVWGVGTRTLTAGTNIALAKGTGVTGFNDLAFADIWTAALTESYATDGAAPTPAQALMMILQSIMEISISGTTMTVKKLDGSTTAMTVTLNDATNPTSRTRSG